MTRAFLALGSNLGNRLQFLNDAISSIEDLEAASAVYETPPVGGPEQGAYLNMVVRLETDKSARELLELCRELEAAAERERKVRWGPRTLDVDVLWVDGETVDEDDLIVPHPRMFDRAFVVVPLRDVGADIIPEGWSSDDEAEVIEVGRIR